LRVILPLDVASCRTNVEHLCFELLLLVQFCRECKRSCANVAFLTRRYCSYSDVSLMGTGTV